MTILVTGFSSFPGVPVNPCETVLKWVDELCDTKHVRTKLLPVSFAQSVAEVAAVITELRPTFLIHFGVSRRAKGIQIEAVAYNSRRAQIPDIDQQWYNGTPIVRELEYEAAIHTKVPVQNLIASVQSVLPTHDGTLSITESNDPGRYVCNNLYWNSLYKHPEIPSIFVHIPMIDNGNAAAMRKGVINLIDCLPSLNQ